MITGLLIALALASCTTQQSTEFDRTEVVGAVYDDVGRPVVGAEVSVGRRTGITDAAGRFRIGELRPGGHVVEAWAPGHERRETAIAVHSRTQFLRVQLASVGGLVDEAIAHVSSGEHVRAAETLERIELIAPDDPRTRLLRHVIEVQQDHALQQDHTGEVEQ